MGKQGHILSNRARRRAVQNGSLSVTQEIVEDGRDMTQVFHAFLAQVHGAKEDPQNICQNAKCIFRNPSGSAEAVIKNLF
jgi:hypothetical protein